MKLCVLSESPSDEAAIRILMAGIRSSPIESVPGPEIRTRGVSGVFRVLDVVIRYLHYRTLADGLVVVVDSDEGPIHLPSHKDPGKEDPRCRLCQLEQMAARTLNRLSRVAGRPSLRIAVGLAVPPIEAWYLFQKNHQLGEAAWSASRSQGKFPQTKAQLKQQLYGKAPVSLARQTECAVQEAYRLVNSLDGLSACFPGGFGTLAKEVRSW